MKIRLFKVWAKTWENWKTERERERKREDRHKQEVTTYSSKIRYIQKKIIVRKEVK